MKAELLKTDPRVQRAESRILGVLPKLGEFLLNPRMGRTPEPFRKHSGTQTWKTRNQMRIVPQDDPQPEEGPSVCDSRQLIDSHSDEAPYMLTRVQEEIRYRPHMVTGVQE